MFLYSKKLKNHYVSLNHKYIADNKQFCRTVKPLLSGKSKSTKKITLEMDNKIITENKDNAEILNPFFSNTVKKNQDPQFNGFNPLAENVPHLSMIAMKNARNGPSFYFCRVSINYVLKEIKRSEQGNLHRSLIFLWKL